MLARVTKTLVNICLLRAGPQQLPHSRMLLSLIIVISFIVSVLISGIVYSVKIAGLSSIAGLFFSFAFVKILLIKKSERFVQTFSAILGTTTLINIMSLPSVYSLTYITLGESAEIFFNLTGFAIFVWIVIVYGYIFSKALSLTMGYAVAISVGYVLLSVIILNLFTAAGIPA